MDLRDKKCEPCSGGIASLTKTEIIDLRRRIDSAWNLTLDNRITREYLFVNYKHTMSFVNKVAALAESEGHHPVMHVYYGKIVIEIWTHAINGLSENDFILASKIDALKLID